ncbi:MAG: FHA domain-containing protein [Planctomycetes bacterium]|nr:FHA domain-containing protein [Planctomycetota bacterium]
MPSLVLLADGKETRYALEPRTYTVGRSADCDIQVPEERASRHHLSLEPTERGWVIQDMDSSNGTALNGYGVSRALLSPGDVIEVGGVELRFEGEGAAQAPRAPRGPRPAPSSAPVWIAASALLLVIAFATDEAAVGEAMDRDRSIREATARAAHLEFLVASRQPDPAEGERLLSEWIAANAGSPDAAAARERLLEIRASREVRAAAAADWEALRAAAPSLHPGEYRWRLESLVRRWSDSGEALEEIRSRSTAAPGPAPAREDSRLLLEQRRKEAAAASAEGNHGRALSLWASLAASTGATDPILDEVRAGARAAEDAAARAAEGVLQRAHALRDEGKPEEGLRLLRGALPALEGTGGGHRVEARIRAGMGMPSRAAGGTAGSPGKGAEAGGNAAEWALQRRAAKEAEQFVVLRDFRGAQREYAAIAAEAAAAKVREEARREFEERALWLGRVADLLDAVKGLQGGWKGKPWPESWESVPAQELHGYLARAVKTPADRLTLASYAYDQSLRKEAVEAVCRALDDPSTREEAQRLYARREGIPVPEGGFVADRGEVISRGEWNRRRNAEAIAKLKEREVSLVRRLQETPVARSLAKLAALRAELDRRRAKALELIFDEVRYFYPYQDRRAEYDPVQREVDLRVEAVREIWDDRTRVRTKPDSGCASLLKEIDEAAAKLRELGAEPTAEEAEAARFRTRLDLDLDVRSFFLDAAERERFERDAGVMRENASRKSIADESEKRQVEITNEYRLMFGRPAVLLNDTLVLSSRAHGVDMSKGGFFNHFNVRLQNMKPGEKVPKQACGCSSEGLVPGCSHGPDARMRAQGYEFVACSENIHAGSGDPEGAHRGWIHSSGHHRNILTSEWREMGTGREGKFWTQNFGLPLVRGAPPEGGDGAGSSPWDGAGGRGTGGDGNPPREEER